MGQTFGTITMASDSGATVLSTLDTRTDTLRSAFSGTSFPGSPVEGQFCLRTDTDTLYVYADLLGSGAGWYEVAVAGKLHGDLNLNLNELVDARLENLGSHETPASGNDGQIYLLTGDGEAYFCDYTVDDAVKKICAVIPGTTTGTVDIPLASAWLDASNPPTLGTKGTTPTVRGYLFDAANELMSLNIRVPANYSSDGDLTLRLTCILNAAETIGDDVDWVADYLSLADGESATGTNSATADSLTDIGTNNAEGDLIECDLTIDYDDPTNPVAAGDWLLMEIHRVDVAEVAGVILTKATLIYPVDGAIQ